MDLLHEDIYQDSGRQNLVGKMIVQSGPNKLRAEIRRNAYDNQSGAKVERWNGEEWKLVESFNIEDLSIHDFSYVQEVEKWFGDMREDLISILIGALSILEGRKIPFTEI